MGDDNPSINVMIMQSPTKQMELNMGTEDNFQILKDDSIDQVKRKIYIGVQNDSRISEDIPITAMYLMCKRQIQLSSIGVFDILSRNGKQVITKEKAIGFLSNIEGIDISSIEAKKEILYEDILALGLDNKSFTIKAPIGQRFVTLDNQYPFIANPFEVTEYDVILAQSASDITTTTNSSCLFDIQEMEPTIYVFSCTSCLLNAKNNNLSEVSTINIYFPLLANENINSLNSYLAKEQELISESK